MKICALVNDHNTSQFQITFNFQEFIYRSLMNINSFKKKHKLLKPRKRIT